MIAVVVMLMGLQVAAEAPFVAPAQPAAASPPIVVEVRAQTEAGRVVPAAGAEVRLELTKVSEMDGEVSIERAWLASAGPDGRATFVDVPEGAPGRSMRAVARWHGVEWPDEVSGRGQATTIVVYPVTPDRSSLRARIGYSVVLSEEEIIVDSAIHIAPTDDPRAVDLERGQGLRVPLLVHAVYDTPLEWGWVPPRPNPETTRFELEPPGDQLGRLVVEDGALVFRGIIPPSGIVISAQYPVPYAEDTRHTLGTSSPVDLEALQVSLPLVPGVAPEVALRRPFEAVTRQAGEGERRVLVPVTMPKAGEPILLDVYDTPSRLALVRPLTVALAIALVMILSLVYMRTRRS